MLRIYSTLLALCIMVSLPGRAMADSTLERVEGTYKVQDIRRAQGSSLQVIFSPVKNKSLPILLLETDSIHQRLKKNMPFRMKAFIQQKNAQQQKQHHTIVQALVYIPSKSGPVPVWLLAKNAKRLNLSELPFLNMHAPSSDYTVF